MADELSSILQNNSEKLSSTHPEDAHSAASSDLDSADGKYSPEPPSDKMASVLPPSANYHIPAHTVDANTGPKGVIADARSFERAKWQGWRSRKSPAPKSGGKESPPRRRWHEKTGSSEGSAEDDDEDFMQRWRNNRLTELKTTGEVRNRRQSPSMRQFGRMETVDAVGYLDAVEKVGPDTVVVVCIYDDQSEVSRIIESHLGSLAQKHVTTRFVRLHYSEAEMDVASVPAVLAYKQGDLFANLVSIIDELPSDETVSVELLETFLKRHSVLE